MTKLKVFRALAALSLLSFSIFASSPNSIQGNDEMKKLESRDQDVKKDGVTRESPFACNVTGLTTEQRQRYLALAKKMQNTKQEIRELEDGYAIRFSIEGSTIQDLAEFITYERKCCPFFDLEIALEREGGPAWLRLRGREGVKEFIRAEFGMNK